MFNLFLSIALKKGVVTLIDHNGQSHMFGHGTPHVTLRVADSKTDKALAFNPWLTLGEAYMNGKITIESGSLYDMLEIAMKNSQLFSGRSWQIITDVSRYMSRLLQRANSRRLARAQVAHHYDLSLDLFEMFLDENLQYSCGYFPDDTLSLNAAQEAKMAHIAAKLVLEPGQRVLDIGCGWGGLAIYLASHNDVTVTGITLSSEQYAAATELVRKKGLCNRVEIKIADYREEQGHYDRIVSVGMFEHVGVPNYPNFIEAIENLLEPDGIALLHSIGRRNGPGSTNQWERKYIFPGGYSPALSELVPVVERSSLWITDIEILRLHYAKTIRLWRESFSRNRKAVEEMYDEKFYRMWDFYLTASELSFRYNNYMVFQMQLARGINDVPLTRNYIYE